MKITDNSIIGIRRYFKEKLTNCCDLEEIESLFFEALETVFGINKTKYALEKDYLRFSESELLNWMRFTKELAKNRPIQHLQEVVEFMELRLKVNDQVLIPRPETEELVALILKEYSAYSTLKILEVGTGSGCIGLALAKHLPKATVLSIDKSDSAIQLAKENALENKISNLDFLVADVFEFSPTSTYDILVSNPPYVLPSEKKVMHPRVLNFEPEMALFVEEQSPIVFYETMLSWKKHIKHVYFEGNPLTLKKVLIDGVKKGWNSGQVLRDLNGRWRFAKFS